MGETILTTNKLCKTFSNEGVQQHVLRNLDISFEKGDFTVIMAHPELVNPRFCMRYPVWINQPLETSIMEIRKFRATAMTNLLFSGADTVGLFFSRFICWRI